MMSEELGFGSTEPNEFRAALATLAAFLTIGFLPLMVFVYDLCAPADIGNAFTWSASMTARFVDQAWWAVRPRESGRRRTRRRIGVRHRRVPPKASPEPLPAD
jgi:hypothetical protein